MLSNLVAADNAALIALCVALPIVFLGLGVLIGYFVYKKYFEKKTQNAEGSAEKIIEDANQEAKALRKEALLEAKEEQLRLRNDFEKETRQRRSELQKIENRLNQKEDAIDKKENALDNRLAEVDRQRKDLNDRNTELDIRESEIAKQRELAGAELERIAGLTRDEAKQILIDGMTESAKAEAAGAIKAIEEQAKEEGAKKAKEIIGLAIQRCAVDHAAETTVSIVELPNEEMKGRIIGRVGRNIKSFESATGVDVIIDDTPDVVTLSGFDPVRREIARVTLQRLIADGRIHPGRIEEIAERVKREIDNQIKSTGEDAVYEAGILGGMHPELVKLLGKLKYRTSYGQNILKHSLEVCFIAGLIAQELGIDSKTAKRAGLLHDIGKAVDHEYEGTHVQIGVDLARRYKEKDIVINCIAAHHGDVQPETLEAVIVQTADAISGARPGARRESIENYVKRLEKLENLANSFAGVEQSYAIQAGREIRVMVKPEQVNDARAVFLAKDIAQKLESELEYPGQIKVNVIRETRSIEYAK